MERFVRITALLVAGCLAGTLFLFALAVALGMATAGVVAFFAAYAISPEETKKLVSRTGALLDGWVKAMTEMVADAGSLVREVVLGRGRSESQDAASPSEPAASASSTPERTRD